MKYSRIEVTEKDSGISHIIETCSKYDAKHKLTSAKNYYGVVKYTFQETKYDQLNQQTSNPTISGIMASIE